MFTLIDTLFEGCHRNGACIPDPAQAIIFQVGDGRSRSLALDIYFLHCDWVYRNAVKQRLDGPSGKLADQQHMFQVWEALSYARLMVGDNGLRTECKSEEPV